jgi:hypothetical protein
MLLPRRSFPLTEKNPSDGTRLLYHNDQESWHTSMHSMHVLARIHIQFLLFAMHTKHDQSVYSYAPISHIYSCPSGRFTPR